MCSIVNTEVAQYYIETGAVAGLAPSWHVYLSTILLHVDNCMSILAYSNCHICTKQPNHNT